jgi:5,10-methylenetetrahydromethanopterin reductase
MPGWMRSVGAWPKSPLTLLDEYSTALRTLLRGDVLTLDGTYVTVSDVVLESPASNPPRVVAGVRGPKSLALAGRVCDGAIGDGADAALEGFAQVL